MSFSLRRLELGDLDAIERIERASYPTPWSRSMFAGELAKQSSLSIAAVTPDEQLVGYLVLSRYVDAWHVMNVAVDPEHRRHGIATAMLAPAVRGDPGRRRAWLHARGPRLEPRRDRPLRELRLRLAWRPTWLLH